jgi:AraC-like DNA-binding protein
MVVILVERREKCLYDLDVDEPVPSHCQVEAWCPPVPGIAEVLHAHIVDYAYPPHCHDTWTVLIVDAGAIRYDLDTRHCGASGTTVAILPPGVIHDGRPADGAPDGFWKRNLYLESSFLPESLIGAAVDRTNLRDPQLRAMLASLHDALVLGEGPLDGEARLAMVAERITTHLATQCDPRRAPESAIAWELRHLLDDHLTESIRLAEVAEALDRSVPHVIRSFTRSFGVSPYAYLMGRRIEAARGMLLAGVRITDVAFTLGFYDQAHFSRHFKRHTSISPVHYAASHN